ncbi:MAG: DUF2029 domain-containing protein [Marinicaulis sp.]|nr:DUF2029 domain-containing protein [Marinicaulis sp.]
MTAATENNFTGAFAARYPLLSALFLENRKATYLVIAGFFALLYIFSLVLALLNPAATSEHAVAGGDFVVFWTAAQNAFTENPGALYDMAVLEADLQKAFPGDTSFSLSWLYPPNSYLMFAPFAGAPYTTSLLIWWTGGLAAFAWMLSRLWKNFAAIFIALASAAVFQALITGQTGFITATLICLAAFKPDKRPIIAGVAAGLLTFKPQFGLLIPVAYAAAGCWRAFGIAAITAVGAAAASMALFGPDLWSAFFNAITEHSARIQGGDLSNYKLVSPFGGLVILGLPANIALYGQLIVSAAAAVFVAFVWRRVGAWNWRMVALCTGAVIANPYAYYYELTILIPPLLLIAKRALDGSSTWRTGDRPALLLLWIAPLLVTGIGAAETLPIASVITLLAFLICARTVWIDGLKTI